MSIFDGVVLVAVLLGMWHGHRKGFAAQMAAIVSLTVGFAAATSVSRLAPVARILEALLGVDPAFATVLAWASVYFGVSFALVIVVYIYRDKLEAIKAEWLDDNLGSAFGGMKVFLLCLGITVVVAGISDRARAAIIRTRTGRIMARTVTLIDGIVPPALHQRFASMLGGFDTLPPAAGGRSGTQVARPSDGGWPIPAGLAGRADAVLGGAASVSSSATVTPTSSQPLPAALPRPAPTAPPPPRPVGAIGEPPPSELVDPGEPQCVEDGDDAADSKSLPTWPPRARKKDR